MMPGSRGVGRAFGAATLIVALLGGAAGAERMSPPGQFLASKDAAVVAVVRVETVKTAWVDCEGNMISVLLVRCAMEAPLKGGAKWAKGQKATVLQLDYTDMIDGPISPPASEGHGYLLWASPIRADGDQAFLARTGAAWMAEQTGLLRVRGEGGGSFVFWNGKCYSLGAIRDALGSGAASSLEKIDDPLVRAEVAGRRMTAGDIGDAKAFVRGLLPGIKDPEAEVRKIAPGRPAEEGGVHLDMHESQNSPFYIRQMSLSLLHSLGSAAEHRDLVVESLRPHVKAAAADLRFAVALVLADLGDDSGKEELSDALANGRPDFGTDPKTGVRHSGCFRYDDSAKAAAAYALGRIGDRSGLGDKDVRIQLAAADGLVSRGGAGLQEALQRIAAPLDAEVEKLARAGRLSAPREKRDLTSRYPRAWTKTHQLLALAGSDDSLKRLVEAWLTDLKTYPETDPTDVGMAAYRFDPYSPGWPGLRGAIRGSDATDAGLLKRLSRLFGADERWKGAALAGLRAALGDDAAAMPASRQSAGPDRKEIIKAVKEALASDEPELRAQGLAAAGTHGIDELYEKVLSVALEGKGVEQQAALFGLGVYGRDVPDDKLRAMLKGGDALKRLSVIEIATRSRPERFAAEVMGFAGEVVGEAPSPWEEEQDEFELEVTITNTVRMMVRLARSGLPKALLAGLADERAGVRWMTVKALGMSGAPEAIEHLKPLAADRSEHVRRAVKRALELIGPAG